MIAPLAAATLFLGLATAGVISSNTTRIDYGTTGSATLDSPRTEYSQTGLDTPPTTYGPPAMSSSPIPMSPIALSSYPTMAHPTRSSTPLGTSSPIALSSYPTIAHPTLANGHTTTFRMVHTEQTQDSLDMPTSYPQPKSTVQSPEPPSAIALSSYKTAAHPTLPTPYTDATTIYESPIALTSYTTAAPPTLPLSQDAQQTPTQTYVPAIVHTEAPAQSLEIPSSDQTISQGIVKPTPGLVPGADESGPHSPNEVPQEIVSIPATVVTMAPGMVVTMGGYQSTVSLGETANSEPTPLVTTLSEYVETMSGGQVTTVPAAVYTLPVLSVSVSSSTTASTSSGDEPGATAQPGGDGGSGLEESEGAAPKTHVGLWKYPLMGMVVGAVALI